MSMSVITIIGAGWLGSPLAHCFSQSHTVYASKTSAGGLAQFTNSAVNGFIVDLADPDSPLEKQLLIQQPETVIGCFPPGFRRGQSNDYIHYWQRLADACRSANVNKLIMISTTGVYPDRPQIMKEDEASLELTRNQSDFSEKSRILLEAEQAVIDSGLNYVIIRCGGLFGPNRNPARFAAKLSSVSHDAPANMIHLDDVIGIVTFAQHSLNHQVVNAVAPQRPSKADFYRAALEQTGRGNELPPIVDHTDKGISANKLIGLGYTFRFPSPIDALPYC